MEANDDPIEDFPADDTSPRRLPPDEPRIAGWKIVVGGLILLIVVTITIWWLFA